MDASAPKPAQDPDPVAVEVEVSDAALRIVLSDGRELSAPPGGWTPGRGAGPGGAAPRRPPPP